MKLKAEEMEKIIDWAATVDFFSLNVSEQIKFAMSVETFASSLKPMYEKYKKEENKPRKWIVEL